MAVRLSSLTVKSALVVATLNNPPCFFFLWRSDCEE